MIKNISTEKDTDELEHVLKQTHIDQAEEFLADNMEFMHGGENPFTSYMRGLFRDKKLRQTDVFLEADLSERYGYKLISGEKKTKQRDTILRICYAAGFSLEETQKALKLYGFPELYAKIPRDALLMIALNERPGTIMDVNLFLDKYGVDSLRASGIQE